MAAFLVSEYIEMKTLSRLGIVRDFGEIESWEIDAWSIIEESINKAEKEKLESLGKGSKRKRGR